MPRRCYGEHKLFAPIRPIALTLCDVYSLARANRQLAVGLAVIAGLLVFAAYKLAMTFELSAAELIYRAIQAYLSKKATGMFTQGALHLLFSNLTFAAFRLCAYLALRAAYDLGRDVVFALSLLVFATLLAAVFPTALVGERWMGAAWSQQLAVTAFGLAAFIGWFWVRYIAESNPRHRSFDFDVGEAIVSLRRL